MIFFSLEKHAKIVMYANDVTLCSSSVRTSELSSTLQKDLDLAVEWMRIIRLNENQMI